MLAKKSHFDADEIIAMKRFNRDVYHIHKVYEMKAFILRRHKPTNN
jgi:hypothetical protein